MFIEDTQCCAVNEIGDLSHHNSPKEAMLAFCNNLVDDNGNDGYYDYTNSQYGVWTPNKKSALYKPSAFYTFTGVVKHSKGKGQPPQDGKYAPNFAAYILKNKLGTVVESRPAPNRVNHPDHFVKVYIWHPNERALKAWWRKHNG